MGALKILEGMFAERDLALDFVEHEVGCNDFETNWKIIRGRKDPVRLVQKWLDETGAEADAGAIVKIIDELADRRTTWLTPFNRRLQAQN